MEKLQIFAHPWWVNLLIIVPVATYIALRSKGLQLARRQLLILTIFAAAFGFVEASVVVYLRASVGLLPGYSSATLTELRRLSAGDQREPSIAQFPRGLMAIEVFREAATMVILISVGLLTGWNARERWASFLWAFAVWDIAYYAGLWATVGWPRSLEDQDVLFLIPVPWLAQVWFPLLVSSLTLLAVGLARNISARVPESLATND